MRGLATFLKWQPPWVASQTGMHLQLSRPPITASRSPTSSGHVRPPGFPSPRDFLPCPEDFPLLLTPRTHLPNRFLKCGLMCSPSPKARSRAEPQQVSRAQYEPSGPPASTLPAGLAPPTRHHGTRAARVPHPGPSCSRKQPHNKQEGRIGCPRPRAHRLGTTPHPTCAARCPNPRAQREQSAGEVARGRRQGWRDTAPRGARSGSKRSTGT